MLRRPSMLLLTLAAGASALVAGSAEAGPLAERLGFGKSKTTVVGDYAEACAAEGCLADGCTAPQMAAPCGDGCAPGSCISGDCTPGSCLGDGCDAGGAGGCNAGGGFGPFGGGSGEPPRYSKEWWALRAMDPPGSRQKCKYGKKWPVYPRPTGKKQTLVHRYHTAHYWPYPYICLDRTSVNVTTELTAMSGFEDLTTFYPCHFVAEGSELNSSGRQHLYQLLTALPQERRQKLYVARDQHAVEARLASLEQAVVEMTGSSSQVAILPRDSVQQTQPANETERTYRMRLDSVPTPQLPSMSQGGGAAGGAQQAPQ